MLIKSSGFNHSSMVYYKSTEILIPEKWKQILEKMSRSSRPEVLCKKGVLRNFAKSTGKHLCQSLFFNKVAGLRFATL